MFFTLHNFYILLSLSASIVHGILLVCACFGFKFFFCLFLFFMEFCWFVAMGCLDLSFFFFCFFFLCRFPRFLLLPLLSNLWQRRIKKTCEPPSNLLTFIDNGINVIFGKNFNIDFNIISPKQY